MTREEIRVTFKTPRRKEKALAFQTINAANLFWSRNHLRWDYGYVETRIVSEWHRVAATDTCKLKEPPCKPQ